MAKQKRGKTPKTTAERSHNSQHETQTQINPPPPPPTISTLQQIRESPSLWYKLRILIFDLYNISKYPICASRLNQTIDELYISAPYFTEKEAASIKSAQLGTDEEDAATTITTTTIEEAISTKLENFFEKRKASGDARPCGPHDMVPVFLNVFGMDKQEIEEKGFVERVMKKGALSAI